jgi:two-component system, sensor histidine kinase and response regulator
LQDINSGLLKVTDMASFQTDLPLISSYDPWLILLSIAVAVAASYVALDLTGRVRRDEGSHRRWWLIGGASAMGTGIWTMHFIGMLAFQLPIPIRYDIGVVAVSLAAAVLASGVALSTLGHREMILSKLLRGSIFMGLGIVAMHYTGMAAIRSTANTTYTPWIVTLSVVVAIGVSFVGLWLVSFLHDQSGEVLPQKKFIGAIVLGCAIPSMHYTAMAAASFLPDHSMRIQHASGIDISLLGGFAITMGTFIILGLAILAAYVNRHHQTLQATESRYQTLYGSSSDAVMLMNDKGFFDCNPATVAIFGCASREEFFSKDPADLSPPTQPGGVDSPTLISVHIGMAHTLGNHRFEWICQRADTGATFPAEVLLTAIELDRKPVLQAVVRDITERKKLADALQINEERLRLIARAAKDLLRDWDVATNQVWWNESLQTALGYRAEEIEPGIESWENRIHPEDRENILSSIHTMIDNGQNDWSAEYRFRRADGSYSYFLDRGYVLHRDLEGKPLRMLGSMVDLTERKSMEAELQQKETLFRSLIENVQDLITTLNQDGTITYQSPSGELVLGYKPEEMVGRNMLEFIHQEDQPRFTETLKKLLGSHCTLEVQEFRFQHKDGSWRDLESLGKSYADPSGNPILFVTSRDITERQLVAADLKLAKAAAESANRGKSEFLASMSHEIRTPMNAVLGMAELLLNTPLTDKQRHLARSVHYSGTALLSIINSILDFSKMEAGKLVLEQMEFALRETIEEAVDLFADLAGKKELELTCFLPAEIPDRAIGDPARLRQILVNLVGNAVKFTQHGEVTVRLHLLAQDARTVTLKCDVTDTGIGIHPQVQARLFNAFSQADGSTTRQFGGTGLGLAIVKQLVQLMGGEVSIASTPGPGSTFCFTVQLGWVAPKHGTQPVNDQFLSDLRVLIVDDNPTNLFILNAHLTSWGAEVIGADTGAAALELLTQNANTHTPIELAILDIVMPDMDGFMLARAIKADPVISRVDLLALSSGGSHAQSGTAEPPGFFAWLQKPIRQSTLRTCLRGYRQGAAATPTTDGPKPPAPPALGGSVLLVEDNPVNREVATGMLELLGYQVDSAEDGREALEISATGIYDLIIMDCQMPVMDGFTATAGIRDRERQTNGPRIPIIALTANAMIGDRERCLKAGMDDYLSKPFTQQQLKDIVNRWRSQADAASAHGTRGSASCEYPSLPTSTSSDTTDAVDCTAWEPLRILKGPGQPDALHEIIGVYLTSSQALVDILRQPLQDQKHDAMMISAHTLKSSSATLGALRLATLANELEEACRAEHFEQSKRLVALIEAEYQKACAIFRREIASSPKQAA